MVCFTINSEEARGTRRSRTLNRWWSGLLKTWFQVFISMNTFPFFPFDLLDLDLLQISTNRASYKKQTNCNTIAMKVSFLLTMCMDNDRGSSANIQVERKKSQRAKFSGEFSSTQNDKKTWLSQLKQLWLKQFTLHSSILFCSFSVPVSVVLQHLFTLSQFCMLWTWCSINFMANTSASTSECIPQNLICNKWLSNICQSNVVVKEEGERTNLRNATQLRRTWKVHGNSM